MLSAIVVISQHFWSYKHDKIERDDEDTREHQKGISFVKIEKEKKNWETIHLA